MPDKLTVIQITDALGADALSEALNVKPRTIRMAREQGSFPASWFAVVRDLCAVKGVDCPEPLFNFKSPMSNAPLSEAS